MRLIKEKEKAAKESKVTGLEKRGLLLEWYSATAQVCHSCCLFLSQSMPLLLSLSFSLPLCLFFFLSVSFSLILSVIFFLSLSLCLFISLSFSVSLSLCLFLSVSLFVSLFVSYFASFSLSLPFCLFFCLYVFVCTSVFLSLPLFAMSYTLSDLGQAESSRGVRQGPPRLGQKVPSLLSSSSYDVRY